MKARRLPYAIQWSEGMLLHPQHFQQADLRQQSLLHFHASMVSPFHWGVHSLELDREALLGGTLKVLALEAVMPDGLVAHYEEGDPDQILELALDELQDDLRDSPVTIHLAVGSRSVDHGADQGTARFRAVEGRSIADLNTGEGEMRLGSLKPVLHLLPANRLRPVFVSFPLAQVRLEGESYSLTDYVPPLLRVHRRSQLGRQCARLANRLREKALQLAEQQDAPQAQQQAQLIHNLVAALPAFEVMVSTGASHPFQLYLALASLVGQTAAIGRASIPPMLPSYQHENLRACFSAALDSVDRVLQEGLSDAYQGYVFRFDDPIFSLDFDASWADQELILGVRSRDGITEKETLRWLEQAYIGSESRFAWMRAKRVPGPERSFWQGDRDLAPRRGVTLLKVQNHPEFIVPGEILQIRNFDDPDTRRRPVEIVLQLRKSP